MSRDKAQCGASTLLPRPAWACKPVKAQAWNDPGRYISSAIEPFRGTARLPRRTGFVSSPTGRRNKKTAGSNHFGPLADGGEKLRKRPICIKRPDNGATKAR